MRRITTLFLALLLTLSLTACGGTAQPNPPAQTGDDASQTETVSYTHLRAHETRFS